MRRIRVPYPFQWGAPTFDAGDVFAMMMASFVTLVEVCQDSGIDVCFYGLSHWVMLMIFQTAGNIYSELNS